MSSPFVCPRGHRWESSSPQCPICGESVSPSAETTGDTPSQAVSAAQALPPLSVPGYEILIELGRGGMGVVHQARQVSSGRLVAVKVLREASLDSPQLRSRFRTEAEALTRLRHPNVVGLIEAGEQSGRPYFVMELVTGGSLDRHLAGKPQPPRKAAEMVETLARAVAAAHEQGIVHRDLKPGNVLVTDDGTLKLNDFGLARQLDADTRQTATGAVMGTPQYMSPEQAAGRIDAIGPPTDVWALGVILYEMLTGRTPFAGAGMIEVLDQVRSAEPEPPSKRATEVPRDLETICLKCLHKDPARRYRDAGALADDLRRFREDRPIAARRVGWRERATKWRRRHPVIAALAAAAALLLLAASALGLWYWDAYRREKVEYYASYTSRFGVKEGVVRLSEKEARQRDRSYKFVRRGGRVVRMDVVNRYGEPAMVEEGVAQLGRDPVNEARTTKGKECRFEYTRTQQGELLEETAYDRHGNVVWVLHYSSPTTAYYKTPRRAEATGFGRDTVEGLPQARTRAGAAYLDLSWTEEGYEARVRYLDRNGSAATNDGHVYGMRQEHDARGLVVRQTWLDEQGRPVLHARTHVASSILTYDEDGNRIEEAYFDAAGRPCLSWNGFHKIAVQYDERGNPVGEAYFDTNGKPCLHRQGFYRGRGRYDERGNRVEETLFDEKDRPCLNKSGVHKLTASYDEHGNGVEQASFGTAGRPCLDRKGFHLARGRYDERGNRLEETYFDEQGRPCLHKSGVHKLTASYDEHGNLIGEAYFGLDDRPCASTYGFHQARGRHDERGNRVEEAYFGVDGRPCRHTDGMHKMVTRPDERGNPVEVSCFDTDGRPCVNKDGWHQAKGRFDEHGSRTEESYFDVNGRRCRHKDGYHRLTDRYDERGHAIEQSCFGIDDGPCLCKNGWHRAVGRYNERGNRIEEAYFGTDGKPCREPNGSHRITVRYDERDNRIEEASFGLDDRPCLNKLGWHRGTGRYDPRGNRVEESYFGVDGRPCLHRVGYHRVIVRYDDRDRRVEATIYDIDNRKTGRRSFGEGGRTLQTTLFRYARGQTSIPFGKEVACVAVTVDENGRTCEEAYYGGDGRAVRNRYGCARCTIAHDAKGDVVSRNYFDVDGKPVNTRVVVQKVLSDGQAERLKLRAGDILVRYDNQPVTQIAEFLRRRNGEAETDKPRPLVVLRKGERIIVQAAPGSLGVELGDVAIPQAK
jgi:hypothetical protein